MSTTLTVRPLALCLALVASVTYLPNVRAEPAAVGQPHAPAIRRAESHFKRGVELYNEGNAEAAMVEFRRAYDLAPRFPILYNMAQVAYSLNDYAAAVALFERYLAQGGAGVPEERRKAVAEEIKRLRGRMGRVHVICNVQGAQVTIDDVIVGQSPLSAIAVNIGRRKVSVFSTDGRSATQIVEVPAGETVVARLILTAADAPAKPAPDPGQQLSPAPARATGLSTGAIVAWALAGSMAVGAVATGALALQASRELDKAKQSFPVESPDHLRDQEESVSRKALLTDALIAGAVLSGTVALLLTLSRESPERETPPRSTAAISVVPAITLTGLTMQGRF